MPTLSVDTGHRCMDLRIVSLGNLPTIYTNYFLRDTMTTCCLEQLVIAEGQHFDRSAAFYYRD